MKGCAATWTRILLLLGVMAPRYSAQIIGERSRAERASSLSAKSQNRRVREIYGGAMTVQ